MCIYKKCKLIHFLTSKPAEPVGTEDAEELLACILSKNASLKATMTAGQENVYLETTDLASSKNSASKQIYFISG